MRGRTAILATSMLLAAAGGAELPRAAAETPHLPPHDRPAPGKRRGKPLSKRTAPKRKPNRARGRKPRRE